MSVQTLPTYWTWLLPFLNWMPKLNGHDLRADFIAGLTGAVVVLPQGVAFAHTIVPPELGGRGIASRLVQHALAWAREQGLKVRPDCSFVRAYMDKHPEYADMRLPL